VGLIAELGVGRVAVDTAIFIHFIEENPRFLRVGTDAARGDGIVFDRTTNIDGVPDGYRAINERETIKVIVEF